MWTTLEKLATFQPCSHGFGCFNFKHCPGNVLVVSQPLFITSGGNSLHLIWTFIELCLWCKDKLGRLTHLVTWFGSSKPVHISILLFSVWYENMREIECFWLMAELGQRVDIRFWPCTYTCVVYPAAGRLAIKRESKYGTTSPSPHALFAPCLNY
jgi:hypothetical protein